MDFMKSAIVAMVLSLCLIALTPVSSFATDYQIKPRPQWVTHHKVDTSTPIPTNLISDGVFYRLVDDQIKVNAQGQQHYFTRIAQTIVNAKGLDGSSLVEINFDPTYETLVLHDISVIRDGQRLDKMANADISVFKSEHDHDRRIYDGTVTYNAILGDILVGDTIDYSYTIVGSNPVYNSIFSANRTLVWSVPVEHQYHRVLWGKPIPLFVNQKNGTAKVHQQKLGEYTEYSIHVGMATPIEYTSESPEWFLPHHEIFYSELNGWEEVSAWAVSLYSDLGIDRNIKAIAKSIQNQSASKAEQLAIALNYVQSNIRYVGIELGSNSHAPTPAFETLQLKYGDCKDKSVLLLAIMNELGITGFPALVDTREGKALDTLPPSINRFNHVIVNAVVDDETYWLDPTMTDQVGPLTSLYQPDFGFALIVRSQESSLTEMNANSVSNISVAESYVIPSDINEPAELQVTSRYLGQQSQRILSRIEQDGITTVSKQYLEYYQRSYPDTTLISPLNVSTNHETGWTTLKEHYLLDNAFSETDNGYEMYFYASDVRNQLVKPEVVNRNAPFERPHPRQVSNVITLKFSDDNWAFDEESFTENNPYFKFTYNATFNDNVLKLEYHYESKQDHVPADAINDYLDAHERARDHSGYSIIWYKNTISGDKATVPTGPTEYEEVDEFEYLAWYFIVCIILFGLMLVDWRFSAISRKDEETLRFQPTPVLKFAVLSIVTYGLYISYWIYRNFYLIEKQDKKGTWPIARGIFSLFWLYPLYRQLQSHITTSNHDTIEANTADTKGALFPHAFAVLLALAYLLASISINIVERLDVSFLLTFLLPLPVIPFVNYINRLTPRTGNGYKNGAKIGFRHILISLMFLPLLVLESAKVMYISPTGDVIEGEQLWAGDIAFMYRENIISGKESVRYFYSDAIFSNQFDGNGFTDEKVFSYWIDEKSGLLSEMARYDEIRDIKVEYAKDDLENTLVTIVREDDTDFVLYVAPYEGKDKVFVSELMSNWTSRRDNKI